MAITVVGTALTVLMAGLVGPGNSKWPTRKVIGSNGYGSIAGPVEVEYKSDIQDPQKIGLLALN